MRWLLSNHIDLRVRRLVEGELLNAVMPSRRLFTATGMLYLISGAVFMAWGGRVVRTNGYSLPIGIGLSLVGMFCLAAVCFWS